MKELHPVETAEFAAARGLIEEPAFILWVPYVLCKRDAIISAVKACSKTQRHKYGVEIPNTIEEAYALDKKNGNTLWRDALNKEMTNLQVAFDILLSVSQ